MFSSSHDLDMTSPAPARLVSFLIRWSFSAYNKDFACTGQLIVTTPIQAVKLPTTMIGILTSPFDENVLQKQPTEVFCKKRCS